MTDEKFDNEAGAEATFQKLAHQIERSMFEMVNQFKGQVPDHLVGKENHPYPTTVLYEAIFREMKNNIRRQTLIELGFPDPIKATTYEFLDQIEKVTLKSGEQILHRGQKFNDFAIRRPDGYQLDGVTFQSVSAAWNFVSRASDIEVS